MNIPTLPAFAGGEEKKHYVRFENPVDAIRDMTGYVYRVEVIWDECVRVCLTEGSGIERVDDIPADNTGWHFSFTLNEQQTKQIPVGTTPLQIVSVSPDGYTTIDVFNVKRIL